MERKISHLRGLVQAGLEECRQEWSVTGEHKKGRLPWEAAFLGG